MENSRIFNIIRNMGVSAISQMITFILNFISRSVFIYVLGIEYLGINGLFTNILAVLSFAELGIGNAIIFSMYAPLANKNEKKLKALMDLYKKAYKVIGFTIGIIGISIIPLLHFMTDNTQNIRENLVFIYILFLINTVISYFFVYKNSIINADQKGYIVVLYYQIFKIIQNIAQIVLLITTHNYSLYLIIQIICTIVANFLISRKADKMYPYLKHYNSVKLSDSEKKSIFNNVKALILYKFGSVILTGTDNIIISTIMGVSSVGLSSNYTLIITSVTNILNQVLSSITSTIGNLNAIESVNKKEEVFNQLFLISTWIYSFFSIGLMLFVNEFIKLWLGEEYILSIWILFSLVLSFYIVGVQFTSFTYRSTMGLFVQTKYVPIIAAILNIVISIVLGYKIGLTGVFLATSISRILTLCWIDPYYIYKIKFEKSPKFYFIKYLVYMIITIITYFFIKLIITYINIDGWSGLFIKCIIYLIVCNTIYILLALRTKEFKKIYEKIEILFINKSTFKKEINL